MDDPSLLSKDRTTSGLAAKMTDCDKLIREISDPEAAQRFYQDADGMDSLYQFTSKTQHDVYASIDPKTTPELGQQGKVVLVTGAGRGIGRVRKAPSQISALPSREACSRLSRITR